MTAASRAPFFHENLSRFVLSKNILSLTDARGDVIDRKIDPNAFEPSQMLLTQVFIAEDVHYHKPREAATHHDHRGQRPRLQNHRCQKNRFRVPTGNFSHRNPTVAANERSQ